MGALSGTAGAGDSGIRTTAAILPLNRRQHEYSSLDDADYCM